MVINWMFLFTSNKTVSNEVTRFCHGFIWCIQVE